jgi:NADPH-dependent curcumin reductase CurA
LPAHLQLKNRRVARPSRHGRTSHDGTPAPVDFSLILIRRLNVRGFIILDFLPRWQEAVAQLVRWILEGKLKHRETIVEGLENAPDALNQLFDGADSVEKVAG